MTTGSSGAHIFVKIEEYKDVLDIVSLVKDKVNDAKKTLEKLGNLKHEEDAELSSWSTALEDIERKIEQIDGMLMDHEGMEQ